MVTPHASSEPFGNVMVRNSAWSKPVSDYLADFRRWVALPDESAHMNVAVFYDACAVAGDERLLTKAKTTLIDLIHGEQAYLAHFARAVDAFPTPIGLFNKLITSEGKGDALDLKKGGIFPIVHGIRSLAIEHGLLETATDKRIARLRDWTGSWRHRPAPPERSCGHHRFPVWNATCCATPFRW